jgi:hypothetical protein
VNDLAAIAETDNAIEDAIKLVDEGALGTPGLIGKLGDAARERLKIPLSNLFLQRQV